MSMDEVLHHQDQSLNKSRKDQGVNPHQLEEHSRRRAATAIIPVPRWASRRFSLGRYCCTLCSVSLTFHCCSCLEIGNVISTVS